MTKKLIQFLNGHAFIWIKLSMVMGAMAFTADLSQAETDIITSTKQYGEIRVTFSVSGGQTLVKFEHRSNGKLNILVPNMELNALTGRLEALRNPSNMPEAHSDYLSRKETQEIIAFLLEVLRDNRKDRYHFMTKVRLDALATHITMLLGMEIPRAIELERHYGVTTGLVAEDLVWSKPLNHNGSPIQLNIEHLKDLSRLLRKSGSAWRLPTGVELLSASKSTGWIDHALSAGQTFVGRCLAGKLPDKIDTVVLPTNRIGYWTVVSYAVGGEGSPLLIPYPARGTDVAVITSFNSKRPIFYQDTNTSGAELYSVLLVRRAMLQQNPTAASIQ